MLNATLTFVESAFNSTTNYLTGELYPRGNAIVDAPLKTPEMLWMLIPIIVTIILMEFYFGRYKEEELGWNTAFGNSLVLGFVGIDLFRHTYEPLGISIQQALLLGDSKILISIAILLFALLLVLLDFFHFLSKKIAYVISSSSFLHILALLGIVIVYSGNIPLDWTTFFACLLLFIFINLILHLIYLMMPSYESPIQRVFSLDESEKSKK